MGKLAKIKTKQTDSSVEAFINNLENTGQQKDSQALIRLMEKATGDTPRMWGKAMIGFGKRTYKSPATDRAVEWFKIGFAPRKTDLSLHLVIDIQTQADLLAKLGKHKTGKGCLYIRKLEDVDLKILEKLIKEAARGK